MGAIKRIFIIFIVIVLCVSSFAYMFPTLGAYRSQEEAMEHMENPDSDPSFIVSGLTRLVPPGSGPAWMSRVGVDVWDGIPRWGSTDPDDHADPDDHDDTDSVGSLASSNPGVEQ